MYKFRKSQVSKIFNMAFGKYFGKYFWMNFWNEFLTNEEKGIESHYIFLRKIKTELLESDNERKYF